MRTPIAEASFAAASFDVVFCVNVIHHLQRPMDLVRQASRLLRKGGALAVIGGGPHQGSDQWYLYRCFEEAYRRDLARYPGWQVLSEWMAQAGLSALELCEVERYRSSYAGRQVFDDPFLQQGSRSQLALLSQAEYRQGLARIEAEIRAAEGRGETALFEEDVPMLMLVGRKT
ncbi:MAG: methyltransferase domain-containing protein [Anaerolineales bacterium]|nr:methyltransferase domain-containing protein [Anaerolineales bacterium]